VGRPGGVRVALSGLIKQGDILEGFGDPLEKTNCTALPFRLNSYMTELGHLCFLFFSLYDRCRVSQPTQRLTSALRRLGDTAKAGPVYVHVSFAIHCCKTSL
jgi:hypothetical protein